MIRPESNPSPRPRSAPDFALVAELSALHELSALALAADEAQLAHEAVEKATRLFGARRFAILTGRPPHQRVVASIGFKANERIASALSGSAARPNQLVLVYHEGEDDQDVLYFEQTRPLDERITRLYNVFASRLEERLAFFRREEQRREIERALRESEDRNRALLDAIPDLMFVYSRDGTYLDFHTSKPELLAVPADQFLGRNIRDVLPAPAATAFLQGFERAIESGRLQLVEYSIELKGVARVFEGRICPLNGSRLLSIVRDISDGKALQERLAQAQKMESIGCLAGGVAHDFNNMLCAILGHAELALNDLGTPDAVLEHLTQIRRAGERSADLTRQLLAFARKQNVIPRRLDLNAAVEGMLKMLRRLLGEHIELDWLPGPDAGAVRIDPSQLDQILANLCINARDAVGRSGRIVIATTSVAIDDRTAAVPEDIAPGTYARLEISDNGAGMDPEILSRIFEPFFTTKGVGKGTGLGLATVYGAVRQNNGFIQVESHPGKGTTFRIYLPRPAEKAEADPAGSAAPPPSSDSRQTILLIEDEPAILRITTHQLEALGYTVLAADSPLRALELANKHAGHITLVITDVVMPGKNGFELVRELQSVCPRIPCLYMSGYTSTEISRQGNECSSIHFLQKPFSRDELISALHKVLVGTA